MTPLWLIALAEREAEKIRVGDGTARGSKIPWRKRYPDAYAALLARQKEQRRRARS
jgi:hypothetical protein